MRTKKCIDCKKDVPIELMTKSYTTPKSKDGYTNQCLKCRKIKSNVYKKRSRANGGTPYEKLRRKIIENVKGVNPCFRCGHGIFCSLDFHHVDPETKIFRVGNYLEHTPDDIAAEIEKCVLICKNCHAELHKGLWILTEELIGKHQIHMVFESGGWVSNDN